MIVITMTYSEAKVEQERLEKIVRETTFALTQFPKVPPYNLTPDYVKASPEYKKAKMDFDAAWYNLRIFNVMFVKRFKREISEEPRRQKNR